MADTEQFEATLDSIASSLDTLESLLQPVLERPLEETLAELPGPLERARLLFWIAYTIHSCSWIYTKLRAVDPEERGVMDELKRIQTYNGKILAAAQADKAASEGNEAGQDERSMKIDKSAASRFIKAAISNQPPQSSAGSSFYTASATVTDPLEGRDGPGPHTRLSSLARASTKNSESGQDDDSSGSSSEEEGLEVNGGDLAAKEEGSEAESRPTSSAGKKRKFEDDGFIAVASEQPKKVKDPLSGYDNADKPMSKSAKKRAKLAAALAKGSERAAAKSKNVESANESTPATPEQSDSQASKKKAKKEKKRQMKKNRDGQNE